MDVDRSRSAAVVILFLLCSPVSSWPQRLCCEGDTWIKWTEGHRGDYVKAYILGRSEGYSDACYKVVGNWPSPVVLNDKNNVLSRCLKQMPDFSKGPEYFAEQVTQLYTIHPEDRILLITEILEGLGSGKSIQDIHEHPPFATRGGPPADHSQH